MVRTSKNPREVTTRGTPKQRKRERERDVRSECSGGDKRRTLLRRSGHRDIPSGALEIKLS